ncbi:hypothetical protein BB560_000608 [Smittium megazygosporum]|uniref:Uncharacterized protein n=1 Tax=Smittium megazygosporum TaxID=133381 RepID=A0A2T9ZJS7_9FUNG|nr:hypothetical protein BB560_000608 [Smittium megazygosporum]
MEFQQFHCIKASKDCINNSNINIDTNVNKSKNQEIDAFYENWSCKISPGYGSIGISPHFRDIVLAGNYGLCVIDLLKPFESPLTIPTNSQWKVVNVEWSPHKSHDSYVASTFNRSVIVYDFIKSVKKPYIHLCGNSSSVTGFNWSPFDPSMIITTSVDPLIRLWDIRAPSRPVYKYTDWEVSSSCEFDKLNQNIFVTGCQNSVNIWDMRKGSRPMISIDNAHDSTVYSVSTSSKKRNSIITASNDRTVKVWNHSGSNSSYLSSTFYFDKSVSIARYIPNTDSFVVTYKYTDGEIDIFAEGSSEPIHRFLGHRKPVSEFVWATRGQEYVDINHDFREWQLISISADQTLRKWYLPENITNKLSLRRGIAAKSQKICKINKDWVENQITFTKPHLGIIFGPTAKTQTRKKKSKRALSSRENSLNLENFEINGNIHSSATYATNKIHLQKVKNKRRLSIERVSGSNHTVQLQNEKGMLDPTHVRRFEDSKFSLGVYSKWIHYSKASHLGKKFIPDLFNPFKIKQLKEKTLDSLIPDVCDSTLKSTLETVMYEIIRIIENREHIKFIDLKVGKRSIVCTAKTSIFLNKKTTRNSGILVSVSFFMNYPLVPASARIVDFLKKENPDKSDVKYVHYILDCSTDWLSRKSLTQLDFIFYLIQNGTTPLQYFSRVTRYIFSNKFTHQYNKKYTASKKSTSISSTDKPEQAKLDSMKSNEIFEKVSSIKPTPSKELVALIKEREYDSDEENSSSVSTEDWREQSSSSFSSSGIEYDSENLDVSDYSEVSYDSSYLYSSSMFGSNSSYFGYNSSNYKRLPSVYKNYRTIGNEKLQHEQGGDYSAMNVLSAKSRGSNNCPFPRLCGATFSGNNKLVCFFASLYTPATYPGEFELLLLNPKLQKMQTFHTANETLSVSPESTQRYNTMVARLHRSNLSKQINILPKPLVYQGIEYYRAMVQVKIQESSAKSVGIPIDMNEKRKSSSPARYHNSFVTYRDSANASNNFENAQRHVTLLPNENDFYENVNEYDRSLDLNSITSSTNQNKHISYPQCTHKKAKKDFLYGSEGENDEYKLHSTLVSGGNSYKKRNVRFDNSGESFVKANKIGNLLLESDQASTPGVNNSLPDVYREAKHLDFNKPTILPSNNDQKREKHFDQLAPQMNDMELKHTQDGFDEVPRFYFRESIPTNVTLKNENKKNILDVRPNYKFSESECVGPAMQSLSVGNLCLVFDANSWDQVISMNKKSILMLSENLKNRTSEEICAFNSSLFESSGDYLLASAWYLLSLLYSNTHNIGYTSVLELCNPIERSFLLRVLNIHVVARDIENSVLLAFALSPKFGRYNLKVPYYLTPSQNEGPVLAKKFENTLSSGYKSEKFYGKDCGCNMNNALGFKIRHGSGEILALENQAENNQRFLGYSSRKIHFNKIKTSNTRVSKGVLKQGNQDVLYSERSSEKLHNFGANSGEDSNTELYIDKYSRLTDTPLKKSFSNTHISLKENPSGENKIIATLSKILNKSKKSEESTDGIQLKKKNKEKYISNNKKKHQYLKLQELFSKQRTIMSWNYNSKVVLDDIYSSGFTHTSHSINSDSKRNTIQNAEHDNNKVFNDSDGQYFHQTKSGGLKIDDNEAFFETKSMGSSGIPGIPGISQTELFAILEYMAVYTKLLEIYGYTMLAYEIHRVFKENISGLNKPCVEELNDENRKEKFKEIYGRTTKQVKYIARTAGTGSDRKLQDWALSLKASEKKYPVEIKGNEKTNRSEQSSKLVENIDTGEAIESGVYHLQDQAFGVSKAKCFVCEKVVLGHVVVCPKCHHGGHFDHLRKWIMFYLNSKDWCGEQDTRSDRGVESNESVCITASVNEDHRKLAGLEKGIMLPCPTGCGCECIYSEFSIL